MIMNSYFVVVFAGNRYVQYKLSELLDNSFNGMVSEEYSFEGIRFYFPVISVDSGYYINSCNNNQKWKFSVNGEEIKGKKELNNGDYIVVSDGESRYAMLIRSYEECSLSANAYELAFGTIYTIGRSSDSNIVIDASPAASRKHAKLQIGDDGTAIIEDLSTNTGIYVNGKRTSSKKLSDGDHIHVMGYTFIFYKNRIIIPASVRVNGIKLISSFPAYVSKSKESRISFVRSPRIQSGLENRIIEIDPPTAEQKQKEMPFILTAGPSLTMALAMFVSVGVTVSNAIGGKGSSSVITSGVMAFSMLAGALIWPKLTRSYNAKQMKASEEYRQMRYKAYLKDKEREIAEAYDKNTKIWNEMLYPDVEGLTNILKSKSHHLWERSIRDEDFLTVRLGTGDRPFEVEISTKKRGFELEDDGLREEGYKLVSKYSKLKDVPITLSLKEHKLVGVYGAFKEIARSIIVNLIMLYSPDELKLVLVYNHDYEDLLKPFIDLPHMWSSDRTRRYVATTKEEAHYLFTELDDVIRTREESLGDNDLRSPYYVILSFDQMIMESVPFKKYIFDENNNIGIAAIYFGERFNQIPKECETIIIDEENGNCGIYIKNENNNDLMGFEKDYISGNLARSFVNEINKIIIKGEKTALDIPDRITFMDMLQVGNVESLNILSHWNSNNSNNSLAAPIGVIAGGERFYLDIHEKYHGCHGLVAGTTGSGKSELLQAYILSMMISYSPNDVAFVLVDFKGGDMARPFLKGPHLAATISNLSGNTLYRALVSLEAEVKNRQAKFNNVANVLGIDKIDINSYQRLFKEHKIHDPLPHLVIIIDEFAQLKTQHPEFMEKLIEIAQVGRSLGVHLILATQKPSGVVDPQIWSNSRFKICLKVMDKQDSTDMINRQVAAMIKNPGRAYVQIGYDEIFELIQSGYSGADYYPQDSFVDENSITVSMVNHPAEIIRESKETARTSRTTSTQLEAVMKEIVRLGNEINIKAKRLWMDPLPEALTLEEIEENNAGFGRAICGLIDLPQYQTQKKYVINFIKDGHLAIYGSAGMGKSTLIQTICYSMVKYHAPDKFGLIVIDCNGSSLANLSQIPHCMAYATDEDENKVFALLEHIGELISDRRRIFNEANCGNYESYINAGNIDMPIILAIIDNYSAFKEKMYRCEDALVQHIAPASSCGIYFIITGVSKSAIYYKITDQISNRIVLSMNDTGSYYDILNTRVPIYPEAVKGRALVLYEKSVAEMQIAVPYDATSDVERMQQLKEFYEYQSSKYGNENLSIDISGKYTSQDDFEEESITIYQAEKPDKIVTVEGNKALFNVIRCNDRNEIGIFSIKNTNRVFIANPVNNTEFPAFVIDELLNRGKRVKMYSAVSVPDVPEEILIPDLDAFVDQFNEDDSVMVINGFSDFFDTISDNALDLFIKIIRENENKTVITIDNMERISMYRGTEAYLQLIRCNRGMVIGGNASDEMTVGLSDAFYKLSSKYRNIELETNQAIAYEDDTYECVEFGR